MFMFTNITSIFEIASSINSQKTFTINTDNVTGTLYYFITSNSAGDSTTGITASDFQNNI